MRIGIIVRHYDQHRGGVRNYTDRLLEHLFRLSTEHEFVLLHKRREQIGRFSQFSNVTEVSLNIPTRLLWDQLAVPWLERTENLDLLFNPKWSMPLIVGCPQVFVCHGLDWYVMPWGSKFLERLSHKYLVPRYANNASTIIAVSESTAADVKRFFATPDQKLEVIYHGIGESFLCLPQPEFTDEVSRRYRLPERYLLYVGGIYPAKNFARLIEAYAQVGPRLDVHLVVAGEHTYLCEKELELPRKLGISQWVLMPGWIGQDELACFYQRAIGLVLPSLYEACPSPILEAMAIGCPVLTGDRKGMSELAAGAAIEVDPERVQSIADGMTRLCADVALRERLIAKGRARAEHFRWEKCAHETLRVLEAALP